MMRAHSLVEDILKCRPSSRSYRSKPLAVTPRQACMLLSIGNTHLYELIRTGELDSYLEGRARRITMESIQRRVARKLGETAAARPGREEEGGA